MSQIKYKTPDGTVVTVEGRLFVCTDRKGKEVYEGDTVDICLLGDPQGQGEAVMRRQIAWPLSSHTEYWTPGTCDIELVPAEAAEPTCDWKEDENGAWITCWDVFGFPTGTPSKNRFKFCPYCGKRIVEHRYKEPELIIGIESPEP